MRVRKGVAVLAIAAMLAWSFSGRSDAEFSYTKESQKDADGNEKASITSLIMEGDSHKAAIVTRYDAEKEDIEYSRFRYQARKAYPVPFGLLEAVGMYEGAIKGPSFQNMGASLRYSGPLHALLRVESPGLGREFGMNTQVMFPVGRFFSVKGEYDKKGDGSRIGYTLDAGIPLAERLDLLGQYRWKRSDGRSKEAFQGSIRYRPMKGLVVECLSKASEYRGQVTFKKEF